MSDEVEERGEKRAGEGDEEVDSYSRKAPRLDDSTTPVPQDPGNKTYGEMHVALKQLCSLVERTDQQEEMTERVRALVNKLAALVTSETSSKEEIPNPVKILQIHLKSVLFNSQGIKEGDNIKNFLNGLEDCSSVVSDRDTSIYVFLANHATELWYQWDKDLGQWKWTPEADGSIWMPCATTVVSSGEWEGETPAPENVEIINYLNAVRPVPSDEQYLPSFCDLVHLLGKLLQLGDDEVAQSVRRIARAVLEFEDLGTLDITVVNGEIKKLEKLVEEEEEEENGDKEEKDGEEGPGKEGNAEEDKEEDNREGGERDAEA